MSYRAYKKPVNPVKIRANPYYMSDSDSDNEEVISKKIRPEKVTEKKKEIDRDFPAISKKTVKKEKHSELANTFSYAAALSKTPEQVKKEICIPIIPSKRPLRPLKPPKKPFNVRTDNWATVESDTEDEYEEEYVY